MENATFLVTVPIVYASVMWFLPLPDAFYSFSVFSRTSSQPTTDATVQSRLQEYKQNHLPDWIPVFIKNGEIYFFVWSMLRLGIPGGWTKPAYADFHLWSLLTTLFGLRWSCHPSAKRSSWHRRVVSTALSVACHLSQLDMPKQIGHVNGVAYVSLALFIGDPWFGLAVYAMFSPVKLILLAQRSTWSTGLALDLAWWCVNDLLTCIFVFSILQHIDILLGSVLQTAVDLEHQVREKEKSMRDRGHLLSATRRLLSVTCDCCETLSDNFEVVQPSQNILALLHIQNPEEDSLLELGISTLPLRQYICGEDQERFAQFIASSCESQAASSLHLRMKTRSGSFFESQIFHVKVPGTERPQHLIGIKSAIAEMTSIPEHSVLEVPVVPSIPLPMVVTGARSHRSRRSGRSSSSKSSASSAVEVTGRPKIGHIALTVDPSDAYSIESLQVFFEGSRRARLTSWVSTRSACPVEGFLQHYLNCWQHAEQSSETCKKVHFKVPEVPVCFTAGEMFVAEVLEAESGEDFPHSMRLVLEGISHP